MTLSQQLSTLGTDLSTWLRVSSFDVLLAVAIGTGIVFALLAIRSLSCKLIERAKGTELHWRTIFARVVARTRFFFVVILSAQLVSDFATPPPSVTLVIHTLFVISAAFQAAIWVRELVIGYVEYKVGGDASHTTLGSAVGIIRLLVSIAVFSIAIILILDNLGVNVTGLVAGLGIGGIAIGLAAKGIFDDLFSALSIIFDKPFRRGDLVKWDQTSGTVEEIGLKSTRVRATTGEEIVISNTNLLNKQLHNLARLNKRRVIEPFSVSFETGPEQLAAIPEIVAEVVKARPKCTLVRCGMTRFSKGFVFEIQFDVASKVFEEVFQAKSAILIEVRRRLAGEGIDFTEMV
jgi:small-conductance mechanosensitive channel